MRESHVCPKCRHNRILLVKQVADEAEYGAGPMRVARALDDARTFWTGKPTTTEVSAGLLSAAICKRCGFTELYTNDPSAIPVDGDWVKEVAGPEPEGPYR